MELAKWVFENPFTFVFLLMGVGAFLTLIAFLIACAIPGPHPDDEIKWVFNRILRFLEKWSKK